MSFDGVGDLGECGLKVVMKGMRVGLLTVLFCKGSKRGM